MNQYSIAFFFVHNMTHVLFLILKANISTRTVPICSNKSQSWHQRKNAFSISVNRDVIHQAWTIYECGRLPRRNMEFSRSLPTLLPQWARLSYANYMEKLLPCASYLNYRQAVRIIQFTTDRCHRNTITTERNASGLGKTRSAVVI